MFTRFHRTVSTILVFAAAQTLSAQLPSSPSPQDSDLAAIHQLLDEARFAQAEPALRTYVATHPLSAEAKYLLADTLFREDKPKESLTAYTEAAKLRTPSPSDLLNVGLDYVLLNDYPDADKWITQSVKGNPLDENAWYSLGRIKYTDNKFHDAQNCFEKALELAPRDVRAENNLGLTYEGLNEEDKAVAAYRTAIAWQQNSAHPSEQPLLNLSIILIEREKYDEALPLLTQANTISPHDPQIHTQLGRLYLAQAQYRKAQAELETAIQLSPGVAATHFQLGQVYRHEGETEKAKAEFATAASLNGTHSSPQTQ